MGPLCGDIGSKGPSESDFDDVTDSRFRVVGGCIRPDGERDFLTRPELTTRC